MEKVEYIKERGGHAIYVNGNFKAWVIGSVKTAKKFYDKHFKSK